MAGRVAMVSNTTNNRATYGDVNINVYGAEGQDVWLLAEEVGDILDGQLIRRSTVFA